MKRRMRFLLWFCALFAASFLFASGAQALFINTGDFDFSCKAGVMTDEGKGTAIEKDFCIRDKGIFSRALCIFESSMLEALTRIQCIMEERAREPITIVLAIYLMVLGISFITGMLNLTFKEVGVAVFKVALVMAFVSSSTLSFQYGYKFFSGFAKQGSQLMLEILAGNSEGHGVMTAPDDMVFGILNWAVMDIDPAAAKKNSTTTKVTGAASAEAFDKMPDICRNMLIILALVILLLVPALFLFFFYTLLKYFWLFARALLGYLSALFLLTFLFAMAPIFVSFSLFTVTRELFDKWLQYLATFALQMVIVFAFFALSHLFEFMPFLNQLASLVRIDNSDGAGLGLLSYIPFIKISPCSLCDMQITASGVSCRSDKVMPLFDIIRRTDFLTWVMVKFSALYIVTTVLDDFLKKAPELARNLGSVRYAVTLGADDVRAGGRGLNFFGMKSLQTGIKGFYTGYRGKGWLFGSTLGATRKGIGEGLTSIFTGGGDPRWIKQRQVLERQYQNALKKHKSARVNTIIAHDVLSHTLKKAAKGEASQAEVAFFTASYKAAQNYQRSQARKIRRIRESIRHHDQHRAPLGHGLTHEVDDIGERSQLLQEGRAQEREDEAAQHWYNFLAAATGIAPAEAEQRRLDALKSYADSLVKDIRDSADYKNLSPYDRNRLDRSISELRNATTYESVDDLNNAIDKLKQDAEALGVNW